MVAHMKTTVEISDPLLEASKETAQREGTTLRALVEEGLRLSLERREEARRGPGFRLRDASVGGRGLRPELRGAAWESIRDLAYEDRGG
jgi:hypothetical protein